MRIPGIDSEKLANYERQLAGLRLECELLSMTLWLRRFHPAQLRVPAGNPDGGEWTIGGVGGDGARVELVQEILLGRLPPLIARLFRAGRIGLEDLELPKERIPGVRGKEAADNVPGWARGEKPKIKESGKDFAQRLMDEKYGPGEHGKGQSSEFNQIKKWSDRAFRIPREYLDEGGT